MSKLPKSVEDAIQNIYQHGGCIYAVSEWFDELRTAIFDALVLERLVGFEEARDDEMGWGKPPEADDFVGIAAHQERNS